MPLNEQQLVQMG